MGRHTASIPIVSRPSAGPGFPQPITDPQLLDPPSMPEAVDDEGIDEIPVSITPRSVQAVLDAEEAAATEDLRPARPHRALEIALAASALMVLGIAVIGALMP